MSDSLRPYGLQPCRLLCPGNSPGKNTGVGSHSLLQGIFLTQGSNLNLLPCRQILYHLSHQGSPTRERAIVVFFPFLLSAQKIKDTRNECVHAQSCSTLCDPMDYSLPSSSVHGIYPGKDTGVFCYFLLQGIMLTQGSNSHLLYLLHYRQILYS